MDVEIVGRERELETLATFLAGEEWPRTLLVSGEAGIGKTTLWRAGVEAAADRYVILSTRPLEAEAKLAYAAVGDLLADVHDAISELPEPQAHALRAALLLETPNSGTVDEHGVSLAFLGVLRALSTEEPLLLAADDVQWLDAASARVLASAARRVTDRRVAFLLAVRAEARAEAPLTVERAFPSLVELPVGGLAPGDVHVLLRERLELNPTRPVLRELHETTRGNPYFALELARTLEERRGHIPGQHAALPPTLKELTEARVSALPDETQGALAAAAALADPTLALVGAATGRDAVAALAPAVDQEIVNLAAGRIRFAHPLLSAAAYAAVDATWRRDLHAVLATLVGEREEQARHLALAAAGPDAEVAAALDEAAALARRRGAPVAAAELLEEARALTPADDQPVALRRAVGAAAHYFEAGDTRRARVLLDEALPRLAAGVDRASALLVLAHVRSYGDDIGAAVGVLEDAIVEAVGEPSVAGRAHEMLAAILFRLRDRFAEAVDHAKAAGAIARAAQNDELLANALGTQLVTEATLGAPEAQETLAAAAALAEVRGSTRALDGTAFSLGVTLMWWERLDEAVETFKAVRAHAEAIGDESSIPYVDVLLAQAECLRGDIAAAAAYADEATARAEQAAQETLVGYGVALRALAAAYAGDEAKARGAARRALELAGSTGRPTEQFATAALGLLEISLERDAEAVEVLTPLVAYARDHEMREPGLTRFVPDLVEALVAVGRLDEAEDHLGWFAANADRLSRRSGQGSAARCRGFIAAARGDLADALTAFEHALAHHEAAPIPFDRARTLLALGAARRRAKERRAARTALEEARQLFASLGARVWEQRAEAELARIGGRAPSSGELTPIERRVAELVAAGRTNREVAVALFLSTRTVEGHLSRVYGKLGVRSRVELTRKLA